jgi:endonuclease YncB( thermonuclease family)
MPVTVSFDFRNDQRPQPRTLNRNSDGDTPVIEQPVRMVSCDTPEKAGFAGGPPTSQPKLDTCRSRLEDGFYNDIPVALRDYLVDRLGADAAENHIEAANTSSDVFAQMLEDRLTKPDGSKRKVATIATGEILDTYGRLLAYLAPWHANTASDPLPPIGDPARNTFNLDMIATGWSAFFPIYPSLPRKSDMNLAIAAAESAWDNQLGPWGLYGETFLLGYEYRMCIKLGTADTAADGIKAAFQRLCIDLRTMENKGKFGFADVPPPYRLWVWEDDKTEAFAKLGVM